MISGFNTDIEFGNTTYHVQTEDKGLRSRLIVSLVYNKGTILASKRASYEDLATSNFDEKVLTDRLNRQHQLICKAVSSGRIEELKAMTAKERAKTNGAAAEAKTPEIAVPPVINPVFEPAVSTSLPNIAETAAHDLPPPTQPETPIPTPVAQPDFDPFSDELILDAVEIIEDDLILEPEAVAVVSELSGIERPSNQKLSLELLGDSKFKGGDRRTVNLMICRGTDRKVVNGAEIMIKVLGSSFRPVIFHAKTDANGLANIHMQLPHFDAGRAALLVRAIADGEEIELRRAVTPG